MSKEPDLFAKRPVSSVDVFTQPVSEAEMARVNEMMAHENDPDLGESFVRQRLAEIRSDLLHGSQNPRPPMPHWRVCWPAARGER